MQNELKFITLREKPRVNLNGSYFDPLIRGETVLFLSWGHIFLFCNVPFNRKFIGGKNEKAKKVT